MFPALFFPNKHNLLLVLNIYKKIYFYIIFCVSPVRIQVSEFDYIYIYKDKQELCISGVLDVMKYMRLVKRQSREKNMLHTTQKSV